MPLVYRVSCGCRRQQNLVLQEATLRYGYMEMPRYPRRGWREDSAWLLRAILPILFVSCDRKDSEYFWRSMGFILFAPCGRKDSEYFWRSMGFILFAPCGRKDSEYFWRSILPVFALFAVNYVFSSSPFSPFG